MATTFTDDIESGVAALRDKVTETVRETIGPKAAEGFADKSDQAIRAARRGLDKASDAGDRAVHQIKQQPVRSVAVAFAAGAFAGIAVAWAIGRCRSQTA